jgi:cyclophilin family peptidyl-prolyl cis-trans isomerase
MLRIVLLSLAALLAAPAALAADPRVELKTTQGSIVLELNAEKAPQTVANFLQYVKDGHYDGTQVHRVIDGFMIQGGGFDRTFREKATRAPIKNEADNGLNNDYGTVAMARRPDPHSASAQFFINVKNNDFLNYKQPSPQGWGYAVFGKVVKGMDVVDRIAKVKTGNVGPHQNVPAEPIIIEWARILNGK